MDRETLQWTYLPRGRTHVVYEDEQKIFHRCAVQKTGMVYYWRASSPKNVTRFGYLPTLKRAKLAAETWATGDN